MKRVEVVWWDACHYAPGEWTEKPRDTHAKVTTIGYVLDDGKQHLVLAQSCSEGLFTGVFSIPRTNIKRIRKLG